MDQITTLDKHIKTMEEVCLNLQEKVLNSHNLTAEDILALRAQQEQNQAAWQWLCNIRADKFPNLIKPNGNGLLKLN
jgi:hypothetical protein